MFSSKHLGRSSYYVFKIREIKMQASPKENGTMFDTQKFVPTPGRSSPNFENVQWVKQINITVHNRICHTILFVIKINKLIKMLAFMCGAKLYFGTEMLSST